MFCFIFVCVFKTRTYISKFTICGCIKHTLFGGGEIAQSLASLSTKRAIWVCARLNLLVTERWNSITVLLPSMCYYICVIMHVKDP